MSDTPSRVSPSATAESITIALTEQELDDLDSAIGDSTTIVEDDWHGSIPSAEVRDYLRRIDALREKLASRSPSSPVPSSEIPNMAPHPLGAHLGPAAIKPRREGDPLLVAEIIRLLERHGVRWDQAVREAAGLMAQSVEEAEGWWAFDTCDVDSPVDEEMIRLKREECASRPPSRGSKEEFGELLEDFAQTVIEWEECKPFGRDECEKAITEARQSVESYVSRLRGEIERLKEINHALVESNGILIGESIGLTTALASLKEQAITPEQARDLIEVLERHPEEFDAIKLGTFPALRLLSTSDSEQK